MDRKEFFSEAFRKILGRGFELLGDVPVVKALEKMGEDTPRKQRPPGARSLDKEFRQLCTGCDACMIACPVNVIMIEDLERRLPVIYPDKDPCIRCDGYPCIQSCPTGALSLQS